MRVIVQPIGSYGQDDYLSKACGTLNILQTIWRFELNKPIDRKKSGKEETYPFDPKLAYDSISIGPTLTPDAQNSTLIVGAFLSRVDTQDYLSLFDKKHCKAIVSSFWWADKCPNVNESAAWIIALSNLALRNHTDLECSDENCLGFKYIISSDLTEFLPRIKLCTDCHAKLQEMEPYRSAEIVGLIDHLRKIWFTDFEPKDFVNLKVPDLPVLERQIRRQIQKGRTKFT